MKRMMKRVTLVIVLASLALASCSPVPSVQTPGPEVKPVPEPPLNAVEQYALVVQGFKAFLQQDDRYKEISSDEDVQEMWDLYETYKLVYNQEEHQVSDILDSFTKDDWDQIVKGADDIGNIAVSTIIYLGSCKTNCLQIFNALWWQCAHYASDRRSFIISDGMMSSHPEPVLCGRTWNWERLVEALEDNCPQYKVEWRGSAVRVTELKRRDVSSSEFELSLSLSPESQTVITVTVVTTAILVGAILCACPECAPVLAPVLLVR